MIVDGGSIGNDSVFRGGGYVDIRGGVIGNDFQIGYTTTGALPNPDEPVVVGGGGRITISGGSVGENMVLHGRRRLRFSGGTVGESFQAMEGSQVSILGSRFLVDNMELASPEAGESIVLTERNVSLTGLLMDGQEFRFDLYDEIGKGDFFSAAATVSVSFVPEPKSANSVLLLWGAATQTPLPKGRKSTFLFAA